MKEMSERLPERERERERERKIGSQRKIKCKIMKVIY